MYIFYFYKVLLGSKKGKLKLGFKSFYMHFYKLSLLMFKVKSTKHKQFNNVPRKGELEFEYHLFYIKDHLTLHHILKPPFLKFYNKEL